MKRSFLLYGLVAAAALLLANTSYATTYVVGGNICQPYFPSEVDHLSHLGNGTKRGTSGGSGASSYISCPLVHDFGASDDDMEVRVYVDLKDSGTSMTCYLNGYDTNGALKDQDLWTRQVQGSYTFLLELLNVPGADYFTVICRVPKNGHVYAISYEDDP